MILKYEPASEPLQVDLELLNPPKVSGQPSTPQVPSILSHHLIEREFFIVNLLVRIHFIIVMSRWTGLVPWEFEFPFPGSRTSTFL